MDRAEKKECVEDLADVFKTTSVVVVAHYSGLTVAQMQTLRKQMRAAGAQVQVAKNRLVKIALEGTDVASIAGLMRGPTLIAYSSDPVAAAKVAVAFAKDNDKLVILGGAMGKTALNVDGVKSLATMPSLDELRAKLSASCRRRRRSSPSSPRRRRPSSRASLRPMPKKTPPDGLDLEKTKSTTDQSKDATWPIWKKSSRICRA